MKVRKLTPAVLKKIIAEEKKNISKQKPVAKNKSRSVKSKKMKITLSEAIDEVTKLALQEAKTIKLLKKIRSRRNSIRSKVKKFSK